jgi:hypothetical protein
VHYFIRGKTVASELAAKSPSQASAHLQALLRKHDLVAQAADYGCGKLRYVSALAKMAGSLTLVDSSIQLDREQMIDGSRTTVRKLAKQKWPTIRIETICEFEANSSPRFDFVLCANVLSAIPSKEARSKALVAIRHRLKTSGTLLVVNQHTNSYFSQVARRNDSMKYLNGYLVPKNKSAFYFGIINRKKTAQILITEGYNVIEQWIEGQSNYAIAQAR